MSESWVPPRLRSVLAAMVDTCRDEAGIEAAWLEGSLARGTADDWSDIDLHLLVRDTAAFDAGIGDWVAQALPVAHIDAIPGVGGAHIVITPDWLHVDVIAHDKRGFTQGPLPARVLYDPHGLVRNIPPSAHEMAGEPYLPEGQPEVFIYLMGAAVTVVRRGEWFAVAQSASVLRDSFLIPLMLAENGIRKSDGARRLNRYLTGEQADALRAIPAVGSDEDQLVQAHAAIAVEYLARARRLAGRLGRPWPTAFEAATLELWRRELGIDLEPAAAPGRP